MGRYLRATTNGIVMDWTERLATFPEWEEVTEQEAFPERFAPVDLTLYAPRVNIEIPEEVFTPPPETSEQASRVPAGLKMAVKASKKK